MITDALLAYLHHIAAFALVAIVFVEMALCKPGMTTAQTRQLTRYDLFYGVFAGVLLIAGFARVYLGAKGAAFYWGNPVFHAKLGVFLLIGLLSVPPTLRYFKWGKALKANPSFTPSADEIKSTRKFIHIQALLIVVLPLLAALMARGIGYTAK